MQKYVSKSNNSELNGKEHIITFYLHFFKEQHKRRIGMFIGKIKRFLSKPKQHQIMNSFNAFLPLLTNRKCKQDPGR